MFLRGLVLFSLAFMMVVLAYPGEGYDQSYFPPSQSYQTYDQEEQPYDRERYDDGEGDRFREEGNEGYDDDNGDNGDDERFQQMDRAAPTMIPSPTAPSTSAAIPPPPTPPSATPPKSDTRPCAKTDDGCIDAELHSDLSSVAKDGAAAKLQGQLEDTEADIVSRKRSIKNELGWIKQVDAILKNYATKSQKVKAHIGTEKKALSDLKMKKKKIKNLIKKKQLEIELRSTTEDLQELQNELKQVQDREAEFDKSKQDLKSKISQLEGEISSLKGDEGGGSTGGSSGAAGDDDDSDDAATGGKF